MLKKLSICLFVVCALFVSYAYAPSSVHTEAAGKTGKTEPFRAVWVATIINLDYPSEPGLSVAQLKAEALEILDNSKALGFNAVIFQVRPSGDALYKSKLFPWSACLTGTQGKAPEEDFDPLEYWVDEAHKRGLELHAWINPYRVARNTQDILGLSSNNPAKANPDWAVTHKDGMSYNPGIPEAKQLILDGIAEILDNYAVDGIHFDDYFYPTNADFDDADTFAKYGKNYSDIANWRRDNVNSLVKSAYELVHNIRKDCVFGISPMAIWANSTSSPYGSDTKGNETYYSQYADSRKWVLNEYLDYVAPQIYWEIGKANSDYAKVLQWWVELVRDTGVKLYVGHATYLADNSSPSSPWHGTDEIYRQAILNQTYPEVKGSIHFRYRLICDNKVIAAALKNINTSSDIEVYLPKADNTPSSSIFPIRMKEPDVGKLYVGRPLSDVTVKNENYYILGASDPNLKLTVNGIEITDRTEEGYFGYYAKLTKGSNTFVFQQGETTFKRTINYQTSSSSNPAGVQSGDTSSPEEDVSSKAEITEAYPLSYDEYLKVGDKITLKCTAPIGAEVKVSIGGISYAMKAASTNIPGTDKIYSTTYTYDYIVPDTAETGKLISIGKPIYYMTYGSVTDTRTAAGTLLCVTPETQLYAKVTSGHAYLYQESSSSKGSVGELTKGQQDYVEEISSGGAWVLLRLGLWVPRNSVEIWKDESILSANASSISYTIGDKWDIITISTSFSTASCAIYDGKTITWTVSSAGATPLLSLPSNSLFSSVTSKIAGTNAIYTFTLKEEGAIDGFYTKASDKNISLHIKRRPVAASGSKPLAGFTFVIDAGHGGSDTGAIGAWGSDFSEKYFNLNASLKLQYELESLGAKVVMTRTEDTSLSLEQRVAVNRSTRPDMFLSIHSNSVSESTNSHNVRGVSTWYKENVAALASEMLVNHLKADLDLGKRGATQSNLYVCRPSWTPSLIVEMGFICNPMDYAWLASDAKQTEFIKSLAQGIILYFTK